MREDRSILFQHYHEITTIINDKINSLFGKPKRVTWRSNYEQESPDIDVGNYLKRREMGRSNCFWDDNIEKESLLKKYSTALPPLYRGKEFSLEGFDKVFASKWVSDSQIIVSTKSNNLIIIDGLTGKLFQLPVISNDESTRQNDFSRTCGIYGISINPSKTLLATGTANNQNIAIYKLPSFEPLAILEGHVDLVFSVEWISDNTLVSASRDNSVALWQIPDLSKIKKYKHYPVVSPKLIRIEHKGKVRSLQFNNTSQEFLTLSSDGYSKIWDANSMKPSATFSLFESNEAVCSAVDAAKNLYAIGSQTQISLLDPRVNHGIVHCIPSVDDGFGVRSLAWTDDVLTIGGGLGRLSFHDIRSQQYIKVGALSNCAVLEADKWSSNYFQSGNGWLKQDNIYYNFFRGNRVPNAIYTLSYDSTQTRLFTAGGPLQLGLTGSYAAIFQ